MKEIIELVPPYTGYFIIGVLVFIVLDVLSGLTKALATASLSSSKMRKGLWHKISILLMVVTALAFDLCLALGLDVAASPVFEGVVLFVILSEVVSILENIEKANPNLKLGKLKKLFGLPENKQSEKEDE